MRRKSGVLATLALAISMAMPASAITLEKMQLTGKNNATVYLHWSGVNFTTNGYIRYSVLRSEDGYNYTTIATGIPRLEYFDISVKPGLTYWYKIQASNGETSVPSQNGYTSYTKGSGYTWKTTDQSIYIPVRDYTHPIYAVNTEYEISLDELLTDGYRDVEGYVVKDRKSDGTIKNNKITELSWQAKPSISDEYDNKFLPHDPSKLSSNINEIVPSGGKNEDYLFLDGNRYLFVKSATRYNTATGTTTTEKCEIPSFTVTKDIVQNNYDNSRSMSRAAEYYPWAGVGYDWRSVGKVLNEGTWFSQGHEKCWYIVTRDKQTNKYGLLCVWGPDQYGARPYSGHPLFLDFDKMYKYKSSSSDTYFYKKNDSFMDSIDANNDHHNFLGLDKSHSEATYYTPKGANGTYNKDNTYSLAFSDNGMSYVHNTGSVFSDTPRWFMINSTHIAASRHDWVPSPTYSTVFNIHKGGGRQIPGSACYLLNVAGNLRPNNLKAGQLTDSRTTAWVWMMPDYPSAYETIRVRAEVIDQWGLNETSKYHRVNILKTQTQFYGHSTGNGFAGRQPYVVPLGGTYDALLQLNQDSWLDGDHANLVYLPNSYVEKNGNNDKDLDDFQTFTFGADYCNISGGCSFDFGGEKYLVLATTRQGNYNMGDFTIYRVKNSNGGDGTIGSYSLGTNISLTPVCNYTSPAIAGKQYSTANGNNESTNAHRTFIRCFNRKANAKAGIDHDYVEIYVYLPGRTINMYSFYGTTINPATPKVEVVPNVVAEGVPNQWGTERAGDNRHQKITHYDAHTGKTEDRVINDSYAHLKEYYVNYTWNTPFTTATKVRDTKWMVSGFGENAPYYYNRAGSSIAIDDSNFTGAKVNESHNYWNYRGIVQNTVGITARPEFKRYFADNQSVSVWGNVERATDKLNYNPQSVTGLSVKVFVDDKASVNNRARVQNRTLYRVDITFNGASTTAYTDNGKTYNIPATRYEVTRSSKSYNGLLDDSESTAAVMIGSNTHAHWKNATDLPGNVNGYMNLNYAACKEQPSYAYVDGNGNGVNQTANSIVIPGNYFTQNWKNHALPAMGYGSAEGGSEPCVLSFLTTDANAASDTYRVRAIYGTDNWNHTTGYTTINPTSIGVSQYADAEVQPSYIGTTGVDDIAAEGVEETDVEYFNLQGVRVDADNLTPGMYIRRSNLGSRKVVVQ